MTTWLNPLYYITADTTPTTVVWDVLAGAYVANTIAAHEAWLNAATPGSGVPQMGGGLVATSNNGSGKLRVQCGDASAIQTGMVLNVVGNVNGAYGAAPVTFVDSTHFDVTSVSYPGTPDTGGDIWSAQWIDTQADMLATINNFNRGQWIGGQILGANTSTFASATTIALINPLVQTQIIASSGVFAGLLTLTLPIANVPGSPPIGAQFLLINTANDGVGHSHACNIFAQDGVTGIAGILGPRSTGLNYNPAVLVELTANTSQNGTWLAQQLAQNPWAASFGGTGTTTNPTDAQILVGQSGNSYLPVSVSGDATLADTGVLTVTGVNGNNPIHVVDGGTGATRYNACRMYLNSTQSGLTNSTWNKINVDTVDFDADSIASTTNHKITPNIAGTFQVSVGCLIDFSAGSVAIAENGVAIAKNGTRVRLSLLNSPAAITEPGVFTVSDLVQMNGTTDFLEIQALGQPGVGNTWQATAGISVTWLSCVRVGP